MRKTEVKNLVGGERIRIGTVSAYSLVSAAPKLATVSHRKWKDTQIEIICDDGTIYMMWEHYGKFWRQVVRLN
jgi:hypothetical protein